MNLTPEQGTNDGIFPIEDSTIPLHYGSVKEARYVSTPNKCPEVNLLILCGRFIVNAPHMGEPAVRLIILDWIKDLIGAG